MKSSPVGSLHPEYVVLGLLAQAPAHGYELHQRLSRDLNQIWHLSQSQIYNILNRLERQAYIRGTVYEQEKLPPKRSFELTAKGLEHFQVWLSEPTRSSVRAIRIEFTTRLYFSLGQDAEFAARLIAEQVIETSSGLEQLKSLHSNIPEEQLFNRLGIELRIRQLDSILDWLDSCLVMAASFPLAKP